jgi:hypothetical protein
VKKGKKRKEKGGRRTGVPEGVRVAVEEQKGRVVQGEFDHGVMILCDRAGAHEAGR